LAAASPGVKRGFWQISRAELQKRQKLSAAAAGGAARQNLSGSSTGKDK